MASIVKLHPVGNSGFANGLSDSIYLRSVTTARDADADVDGREIVFTEHEDGLVDLVAESGGLDELEGLAVDADQATALLCMCNSCRRLSTRNNIHSHWRVVGWSTVSNGYLWVEWLMLTFFLPNVWTAFVDDMIYAGFCDLYKPRLQSKEATKGRACRGK